MLRYLSAFVLCAPVIATPLATQIQKELTPEVSSVRDSEEKQMGVFTEGQDFIAVLKDGREVELTLKFHEWDLDQSPYFWFALAEDPKNDAVLEPTEKGFRLEKIPKSWMATDYQKEGRTQRSASLLAGNVPRQLTKSSDAEYFLDAGFSLNRQLMTSILNTLLLKHDTKTGRVLVANLGVKHCPDEKRARLIINGLTKVARARSAH
jgi:hypothetical protein